MLKERDRIWREKERGKREGLLFDLQGKHLWETNRIMMMMTMMMRK